jgi:hypothetical protein
LVFCLQALGNLPLEVHARHECHHDGAQDHDHEECGNKRGGFLAKAVFHWTLDRNFDRRTGFAGLTGEEGGSFGRIMDDRIIG